MSGLLKLSFDYTKSDTNSNMWPVNFLHE